MTIRKLMRPRPFLEGVVFSRHFPTPSEGVVDAHLRCGYQESYFNEFTSGCTLFFNRLKISGL